MNIVIFGATETGYLIASQFYRTHNIVLVDDLDHMPERFANLDISFASGSGADVLALERAGTTRADFFIACSPQDEANIVACWAAQSKSEVATICFISKRELHRNLSSLSPLNARDRYNIDTIIWPEQLLTQDIFRILMVPEAIDVEFLAEGRAKLFEYRIRENSSICQRRIMDCAFPANVLIVGITREGNLFIPNGSTVIRPGDKVIFMGSSSALDKLSVQLFKNTNRTRSVSVIGGGSVGFMLARQLEGAGVRVKLIEHDRERCNYLADHLETSLILHGDGTDLELLEEEAMGASDVTVCVTNNDEKNLLSSLVARQLGCERIITRVSNAHNRMLFERVGIDVAVSPRESAMKELRNLLHEEAVNILAIVEGGQGEVLRITLADDFPEVLLRDFSPPARAIVGIIKRERNIIFPHGDTRMLPGDQLIVFTMASDAEAIKKELGA